MDLSFRFLSLGKASLVAMTLVLGACSATIDQRPDNLASQADAGDAESQYQLGLSYIGDAEKPDDYVKANEWFTKAAAQNHPEAQYMLAVSYLTGRGAEVDEARALSLFTQAAEQGQARAQYQLGEFYLNGRVVEKDPAWAARWYGKAARQGHARAQYSLGVAYAAGLGLPKDYARAWPWLNAAAVQEVERAAEVRDKVYSRLSSAQKQAAVAMSETLPQPEPGVYADQPTILFTQQRLSALGYEPGPVDGLWGARTRAAIAAFVGKAVEDSKAAVTPALVERLRTSR